MVNTALSESIPAPGLPQRRDQRSPRRAGSPSSREPVRRRAAPLAAADADVVASDCSYVVTLREGSDAMSGPQETPASALERLAGEEYCYLTTTGRVTGRSHEIEIWFGVADGALYMMSGGGQRADWVKNLLKTPAVSVRIADKRFNGTGRLVTDPDEERTVRNLLATKYDEREADGSLDEWARLALPVAVDVEAVQ